MDNKTIAQAFNDVHNVWWRKWRDKPWGRHDPIWEVITREVQEIMDKYNHDPFVVHLLQDLMDELEERSQKGKRSSAHAAGN